MVRMKIKFVHSMPLIFYYNRFKTEQLLLIYYIYISFKRNAINKYKYKIKIY